MTSMRSVENANMLVPDPHVLKQLSLQSHSKYRPHSLSQHFCLLELNSRICMKYKLC